MNSNNILETIKMIEEEKLDVRTITMGISLLDCIDSDGDKARIKIYDKINDRLGVGYKQVRGGKPRRYTSAYYDNVWYKGV